MIAVGIDGGSRAIKIALFDLTTRQISASGACDQGVDPARRAADLLARLLQDSGRTREEIIRTVATGYARNSIPADATVTEITCHAVGVRFQVPEAMSVVEIGGQDSKILRLEPGNAAGLVRDFAMNDRCAAGTGRFLEAVATRLETPLEELGALAAQSTAPAAISATCVVFAETEIIGLLSAGTPAADIVAGVQAAIARRVASMAGPALTNPIVFTGGVARVPGMQAAMECALETSVTLAPDPQQTGAIGAALLAANSRR